MFKCSITGRSSRPNEKCQKLVVSRRPKSYTKFIQDEDTERWMEVTAGNGWEIVKEIDCTQSGMDLWNTWSETERTVFLTERGFITAVV